MQKTMEGLEGPGPHRAMGTPELSLSLRSGVGLVMSLPVPSRQVRNALFPLLTHPASS